MNTLIPRELSADEKSRLETDIQLVSEFRQNKLEKDAKKNWDLFYKRNGDRFFKDRHWTEREFHELLGDDSNESVNDKPNLLEIGCGVGNFFFPLLESNPRFFMYACDFSDQAIKLCKINPKYSEKLCKAFTADITNENFVQLMQSESSSESETLIDVASLIFVLSAIHPSKMSDALTNIYKVG